MGTVPTPVRPGSGTAAASNQPGSWCDVMAFLLQPPACRAVTNAATALSAGVQLIVPFAAETVDNVQSGDTAMHSTSTNNDKVYIRTAGRYDVTAQVYVGGATTSIMGVLLKNGTQMTGEQVGLSGNDRSLTLSDTFVCAVGDYFQLGITATAASTLSTTLPCTLYVKWVSN